MVTVESFAFVEPASTGLHVADSWSLVCPSGHSVQETAPDPEYRPAGHDDGATAPWTHANLPGGAASQVAAASRFA